MVAFATQSNIQTTGTSVLPIGANGAGRSKLMTAAEIRSAASVYSQAQADAAFVSLAGSYANPSWITSLANSKITGLGTLATQSGTFSGTSSGTNTGDQTITLTGDVTGSGTGSFAASIGSAKVTNTMLAGSIAISKLSITGTPDGTKFLRDDGSWQAASGGGGSPGGSSGQIQWNSASAFAGSNFWQSTNTIQQRSGTSAQDFQLFSTYTSGTSFEAVRARGVAAANFEFGPMKGSAGGTLRGFTIGGYANESSAITPWLTFDNAGNSTACTGAVVRLGAYNYLQAGAGIYIGSSYDYPKLGSVTDPKNSGNTTFAQPLWINLANGYPGTNTASLWPGGSMNVQLGLGGYAASGTHNGGDAGRFTVLLAAGAAGVGGGSKGTDSSFRIKAASGQASPTFELVSSSDALLLSIGPTGRFMCAASTTSAASLNVPSGTAPSSPANGDIWSDGSDIKVRLGGVTYTLTKV